MQVPSSPKPLKPLTALVLAAGLGTRMRPLTLSHPKPLIKVKGKALLDYALESLDKALIERVIVNHHYLGEQIISHVSALKKPYKLLLSDERPLLLDSGGAVMKVIDALSDPFIVLNSDTFWRDEMGENTLLSMQKSFDSSKMDALMLLCERAQSLGFEGKGDFFYNNQSGLQRRGEAEAAPYIYAGAIMLSKHLFLDCKCEPFSLNQIFDKALHTKRLFPHFLQGQWFHIGTPQTLTLAEKTL